MQQREFQFDLETECDVQTIIDVLKDEPGWMRAQELSNITGFSTRRIRKLIVKDIRGVMGIAILSGPDGYCWPRCEEDVAKHVSMFLTRAKTATHNYAVAAQISAVAASINITKMLEQEEREKCGITSTKQHR